AARAHWKSTTPMPITFVYSSNLSVIHTKHVMPAIEVAVAIAVYIAITRPTKWAGENSWTIPQAMGVHAPKPIPMRATSTVAVTRSCVQTSVQSAPPPITLDTDTTWTRLRAFHCVIDTRVSETRNKPMPSQDQRYPTSTGPNASSFFPKTGNKVVNAPAPNVYTDAMRISIRMVGWEISA